MAWTLDSLRGRLATYRAGFFDTEQHAKPHGDLERLGREMDGLAEQLSVTLGPEHDAVVAFGDARAAAGDIAETVGLLKDPNRHKVADVQKFVDQTIARIQDHRERFDACRDQFMAVTRDLPAHE